MNQENMPLVTAVIPVYNHEKYVVESIRSILNQTYRNIELIVINDGSKDRSHEMVLTLVEECKQRFVRFEYINRENVGLSATMNQALGMARGTYLSGLSSDDVALPEKIELLVHALQGQDETYAAAFGDALFIDEKGRKLVQGENGSLTSDSSDRPQARFLDFHTKNRNFDYRGKDFGSYKTLLFGNYLPAMSAIVKAEAVRKAGAWTTGNIIEDWEMWLKLSRKHNFLYVDKPVALYRWHALNSVRVALDMLVYGSLLLVDRERHFCSQNQLLSIWKTSHNYLLRELIFNRNIAAWKRLSIVRTEDLGYIFGLVLKAVIKKVIIRR